MARAAALPSDAEWLERLPEKKKPLYTHSLPCIEAWLRSIGFTQAREDRAVWVAEMPLWHARLSLNVTATGAEEGKCGAAAARRGRRARQICRLAGSGPPFP